MTEINPFRLSDTIKIETLSIINHLNEAFGSALPSYRPAFKRMTGSTNAAILLQQLYFWFRSSGYQPYYKFKEPCDHERYRKGDSWCEELEFSRYEFDGAIKKIRAVKVKSGDKKRDVYKDAVVVYWTDKHNVTWYDMNLVNLAKWMLEHSKAKVEIPLYLERLENALSYESGIFTLAEEVENPLYLSTENTTDKTTDTKNMANKFAVPAKAGVGQETSQHKSDVSLESRNVPSTSSNGDRNDVSEKAPMQKKGRSLQEARALSDAKSRRVNASISRTPLTETIVRGENSKVIKHNELPPIGQRVLQFQNAVAQKTGKKLATDMTRVQLSKLRERPILDGIEIRSLEDMYRDLPDVFDQWLKVRLGPALVYLTQNKGFTASTGAIIKQMTNYQMNKTGLMAYLKGTLGNPMDYLSVNGHVMVARTTTPIADTRQESQSAWYLQETPAKAIYMALGVALYGSGTEESMADFTQWIREKEGIEFWDYVHGTIELPEHLIYEVEE